MMSVLDFKGYVMGLQNFLPSLVSMYLFTFGKWNVFFVFKPKILI